MKSFEHYLKSSGELGVVDEQNHSVLTVSGLPRAVVGETVVFEQGEVGQVLSLSQESLEVLLLTAHSVIVGTKAARTGKQLSVAVGDFLLGTATPPVRFEDSNGEHEERLIDADPAGFILRDNVEDAFESGVAVVDLLMPLGLGQKELVIGDRKTGKTQFLLQAMLSQAQKGVVVIYTAVGKRQRDINYIQEFIEKKGIKNSTVLVFSKSSDPSGEVFTTPYSAMAMAEYFKDSGRDVLIILDDMTTHAKYYREIMLLAKRFPGRSSYPGDIFYAHARLLERAGNYKDKSITCLAAAESVQGDISGYIQTNLMAMTDGHLFFDSDLFDQGIRPAVNPFLSVTRVGRQAQAPIIRDLSRELSKFLVTLERLKNFTHFGAELSEETIRVMNTGDRVYKLFSQAPGTIVPMAINVYLLGLIWTGRWASLPLEQVSLDMSKIIEGYQSNISLKNKVNALVSSETQFSKLIIKIKTDTSLLNALLPVEKKNGSSQSLRAQRGNPSEIATSQASLRRQAPRDDK